jgi:hypothetical protein
MGSQGGASREGKSSYERYMRSQDGASRGRKVQRGSGPYKHWLTQRIICLEGFYHTFQAQYVL